MSPASSFVDWDLAEQVAIRVADRAPFAGVHHQRLLRPLFERFEGPSDDEAGGNGDGLGGPSALTARMGGMELGLVLGWMSTRVLGQYDLLVVEDEAAEDQDIVYYVGPNLVALERRYAFSRHDFRLWLALHEVTHRAQWGWRPSWPSTRRVRPSSQR